MITIKIILLCVQYVLLLGAVFCLIKFLYHSHQADRIMDHKGKQTFWQWIKHIDTERGTGIWK